MVDLDKIKQLVEKYYSLEKESKLKDYNEEATKKGFIEPLFRSLGWDCIFLFCRACPNLAFLIPKSGMIFL